MLAHIAFRSLLRVYWSDASKLIFVRAVIDVRDFLKRTSAGVCSSAVREVTSFVD